MNLPLKFDKIALPDVMDDSDLLFSERSPILSERDRQKLCADEGWNLSLDAKWSGALLYSADGAAEYVKIAQAWSGCEPEDDGDARFTDPIFIDDGFVLQSPCNSKRLAFIEMGLDSSEQFDQKICEGLQFLTTGSFCIEGWQAVLRTCSWGADMPAIVLHFIRNGDWPRPEEDLDCDPTLAQLRELAAWEAWGEEQELYSAIEGKEGAGYIARIKRSLADAIERKLCLDGVCHV